MVDHTNAILLAKQGSEMRGGANMDKERKRPVDSENVQSGSLESIAVFEELERRRGFVKSGASQLLSEEESWTLLRKAGIHV